MAIPVSAGNSSTFKPCPAGVHQAVCADVVDMGILEVKWNNEVKKQHKVRIVWQVEDVDPDNNKPYIVQKRYTASLHEKAQLRKDLESWRGRAFTEAELHQFDLEVLLGVNAFINVVHVSRDGKTYANVTAVMPLKKGMDKIATRDYTRVVDREPTTEPSHGSYAEHDDRDSVPPVMDDDIPF